MLLTISVVKKLLEHFMKNNCKKQIRENIGDKNSLKEKNGKSMIIHLIAAELMKMILYKNKAILS